MAAHGETWFLRLFIDDGTEPFVRKSNSHLAGFSLLKIYFYIISTYVFLKLVLGGGAEERIVSETDEQWVQFPFEEMKY